MGRMTASIRSFVYTLTGVEGGSWDKNPARHIRPLSGLVSVPLNKVGGTENHHRSAPTWSQKEREKKARKKKGNFIRRWERES
jgi:hypothetical protein